MNRKGDMVLFSLVIIVLAGVFTWCFDRFAKVQEVSIHTKAGHQLVVVPKGFETIWVVKERGSLADEVGMAVRNAK